MMFQLIASLTFALALSGVGPTFEQAQAVTIHEPRPSRLVLIVDDTEGIRKQIGQIRRALTRFVQTLDARHEMMLVTVSGTLRVAVAPTLERERLSKAISGLFGLGGAMRMHKAIDETFHRFANPSDRRPVFVVVTTEDFESKDWINPQEIQHLVADFRTSGGVLHAVRLLLIDSVRSSGPDPQTEIPVSLEVARLTGGAIASISPAGFDQVLQRLAGAINKSEDAVAASH